MAKVPTVAIIGRPNTGKSTLYNRLIGRRQAIVSDTPGTTRDQIASRIEGQRVDYLLIDTGGITGKKDDEDLEDDIEQQSLLALSLADLILFTINAREELTSADFEAVEHLRKHRRPHVPVLIVLTKCDNPGDTPEILPRCYAFGVSEEILPVSSTHNLGIEELRRSIEHHLLSLHFGKDALQKAQDRPSDVPHIAIVGKSNVGKSSILNALMSDPEREARPKLVSEKPGTTRDATDTTVRFEAKEYLFVDTAGLKRPADIQAGLESFANFRSIQAIEEADTVILVLDALSPVSRQDKRIASLALREGKALIVALNKVDLLQGERRTKALEEARGALSFCAFAPILPCSAVTREGLLRLFPTIDLVHANRTRRIATKDLHTWLQDAVTEKAMGMLATSKHITQADSIPPTFVVFVKDPKKVQHSDLRYLERRLRTTFAFDGTPVRWVTKAG